MYRGRRAVTSRRGGDHHFDRLAGGRRPVEAHLRHRATAAVQCLRPAQRAPGTANYCTEEAHTSQRPDPFSWYEQVWFSSHEPYRVG